MEFELLIYVSEHNKYVLQAQASQRALIILESHYPVSNETDIDHFASATGYGLHVITGKITDKLNAPEGVAPPVLGCDESRFDVSFAHKRLPSRKILALAQGKPYAFGEQ